MPIHFISRCVKCVGETVAARHFIVQVRNKRLELQLAKLYGAVCVCVCFVIVVTRLPKAVAQPAAAAAIPRDYAFPSISPQIFTFISCFAFRRCFFFSLFFAIRSVLFVCYLNYLLTSLLQLINQSEIDCVFV